MDDWTPEEQIEWTTRYAASAPGSKERALLEDMQWTGIFLPASLGSFDEGSLPASPTSPFPSSIAQAPPLPPIAPPVQPVNVSSGIAASGITRRNVPLLKGGKTRKAKKGGEIVTTFFNIRDQVKLYHWQTKSFSEHKATDELVTQLDLNIDKFVEVFMGRYGRPYVKKTLPVKNLTVTGIRSFITKSDEWLASRLPRMLKKTDSDLLNIRDEILADLNQVKYLFTLA